MAQLSPEAALGLIALASLLAGIICTVIYYRRALSALHAELVRAQSTAHAAIGQKDEKLAQITADLASLKEQYSGLTTSKSEVDQSLARTQSGLDGLNRLLGEREQRIQTLEIQLGQEQDKLDVANRSLSDLKAQSKAHQITAERLQYQLDEVKSAQQDKDREYKELNDRFAGMNAKHTELKTAHSEKLAYFEEQKQSFEQSKQQLKTEFQNLANRILEEKGKTFTQTSQSSLDALLKPFREQIEGFQKRVNEVHSESVKGNASLEAEIKKVLDVGIKISGEANRLASALKGDKKTAGLWGEAQLERTLQLAGLTRGDHYASQQRFKDCEGNNNYPDFVVKLPDDKHMVIDSKVSLVNYDQAIAAEREQDLIGALDAHVKAVRNHIDELSKKDYSNLIGMRSPSFVLMFMPVEPAYIEAMKHNKDLFNYGYEKNVVMVSHTTLMPILRTVANLWMIERSNEEAREISGKAGDIYNQVCTVAERLHKLGGTLDAVSNHYNNTVKALVGQQGLHGKVERYRTLSAKVSKSMPNLEPLNSDFEHQRLELVVESVDEKPESDDSIK